MTATAFGATLVNDVVVNCDMLQADNQGNTIKVIAYGRRDFTTNPAYGTAEAHVYCEDWAGNSLIINLPADASRPDVVLADGGVADGNPIYKVVVVYQVNYNAYLDIWELDHAGTSSFSSTSLLTRHLNNNYVDTFHNGPHIDMWSDANNLNPISGLPTMHQFAVVWSEDASAYPYSGGHGPNINADQLYALVGDVNTSPSIWWGPYLMGPDAYNPDVACLTDVNTGHQLMEIAYSQPGARKGAALLQTEFDYTVNSTSSGPFSVTSVPPAQFLGANGTMFPRIEAMSQYDNTTGMIKWQVVASRGLFALPAPAVGNVWYVYGYNPSYSANLSGTSAVLQYNDAKSPCVAAGISPSFSTDLGNQQYTVSFHPWARSAFYNRSINPYSGIEDSHWWEVNDSIANPNAYHWDASRSTAVSNCSNSGLNLLTAWYDGTNIVYKESPNSMVFKQSPTVVPMPAKGSRVTVWPNPVADVLHISGPDDTQYRLSDVMGKAIQQGKLNPGTTLHLGTLPDGIYLLTLIEANGMKTTQRITKQ